jgi:hypothetical protein
LPIRWLIAAFILVCSSAQAADVPHAAVAAIANREFMARFTGYEDYRLLGVFEWRTGVFEVTTLDATGI